MIPFVSQAGTSANYSLGPDALDEGGLRGTSASYTANFSASPGGAGTSANYLVRTGFAGQLRDVIATDLTASPSTVNEGSTRQLSATVRFDDGTSAALAATSVTWSVQSGPLSISASGLATAGAVYQDTTAVARGSYELVAGTLNLTVREVIPDNFGGYAGDGLSDAWQVQFFGLPPNANAAPTANPDGDSFNNLLEFAFGTNPTDITSGFGYITYAGGLITLRAQPTVSIMSTANGVDYRAVFGRRKDYLAAHLTFTVQFSADLLTWEDSAAIPTVVASDAEIDAVTVPYPFFLNTGRKAQFFRVNVTTP